MLLVYHEADLVLLLLPYCLEGRVKLWRLVSGFSPRGPGFLSRGSSRLPLGTLTRWLPPPHLPECFRFTHLMTIKNFEHFFSYHSREVEVPMTGRNSKSNISPHSKKEVKIIQHTNLHGLLFRDLQPMRFVRQRMQCQSVKENFPNLNRDDVLQT